MGKRQKEKTVRVYLDRGASDKDIIVLVCMMVLSLGVLYLIKLVTG